MNTFEIVKKYAQQLDNGYYVVRTGGHLFADACINDNTISELIKALQSRAASKSDCENWGLSPSAWRTSIEMALAAKILIANDDQIPDEHARINQYHD